MRSARAIGLSGTAPISGATATRRGWRIVILSPQNQAAANDRTLTADDRTRRLRISLSSDPGAPPSSGRAKLGGSNRPRSAGRESHHEGFRSRRRAPVLGGGHGQDAPAPAVPTPPAGPGGDWRRKCFSDPYPWQSVTSSGTGGVAPEGRLPEPLAELAEMIETRLEPAPGDRGTQLSARAGGPAGPARQTRLGTAWKGKDPSRQIRNALQHAKQLVEVGEVLVVEPQPAGRRRRPAPACWWT